MDIRTMKLEFHWIEAKAKNDGSVEIKMAGMTVNGVQHHIIFKMGPSSVGYIGQDLHRVAADLQKEMDNIKTMLRGQ